MVQFTYQLLPKAQQEYEDSLEWYKERSLQAALKFIVSVNYTLDMICLHPYRWRNGYKNYYELSVKKYPFSLIYIIEKEKKQVMITSVFHHKRNPKKKYKTSRK